VHTDDLFRLGTAQFAGDRRAPVAALCAVARVAQAAHQFGERGGDPAILPAGLVRRPGQAEAGNVRQYQVECVGKVAAMGPRIGERRGDPGELHDRPRPAVDDDQRGCVWLRGADVGEVDTGPVDCGRELRPLVQSCLGGPPVVLVPPVPHQFLEVVARDAVGPAHVGQLVRPPGAVQTLVQIVQLTLGNLEAERAEALVRHDRHSHACYVFRSQRRSPLVAGSQPEPNHSTRRRRWPSARGPKRATHVTA
jgi:hypothetical protein